MDQLLEDIRSKGEQFCEKLSDVRSVSCADGYFGSFIGDTTIQKARKFADESEDQKERIVTVFRESLQGLYSECGSWNHSLSKPYGYPGDFAMLELVYDQLPHQDTLTSSGRMVDLWGQTTVLPRAVNARMNALRVFIEEFSHKYTSENKAKILSIASGSAREIRDLPRDAFGNIDVVLLDTDKRALNFALSGLISRPGEYQVNTVVANALKPFSDKEIITEKGPFDLIYSFGLYDYLPDELIHKSISLAQPCLKDDGVFVFALKDNRYYPQWFYDWFYDWRFYSRTEADGHRLAAEAAMTVVDTIVVESGTIVLYVCKKA